MKRNIPNNLLTKDLVKDIFNKNSDKVISESLSDATITSMASLYGISPSAPAVLIINTRKATCELLVQNGEPIDFPKKAYSTASIHSVDLQLLETAKDGLTLLFMRDDKLLYEVRFDKRKKGWQDFYIEDIGSGQADDGTVYLSLSIIENDEERDIPYAREVAYVVAPDGEVEEVAFQMWHDSEVGSYYVYDDKQQTFDVSRFKS